MPNSIFVKITNQWIIKKSQPTYFCRNGLFNAPLYTASPPPFSVICIFSIFSKELQ